MKLKIKKITEDAILPTQAHEGDMFDLYSNIDIELNSYIPKIIPLGIAFDIPKNYRIKVFPRSSTSLKKHIIVSNGTGIIDELYKGEVGLICHTTPKKILGFLFNNKIKVKKGDKIAQFQLEKIINTEIEEIQEIDTTNHRGGGYGSTGN